MHKLNFPKIFDRFVVTFFVSPVQYYIIKYHSNNLDASLVVFVTQIPLPNAYICVSHYHVIITYPQNVYKYQY